MIKVHRIWAYMLRHLYEIIETFDRKLDIIFWPTIDLLLFGFLTVYIQKFSPGTGVAAAIIGGLILWALVYNIQRDIAVSLLEDAWSWNLFNLFSTPLRVSEMIIGTLTLSVLKALITVAFTTALAAGVFGFNLLSLGPVLAFYLVNIFVFGWAFGCLTASLIFRFGTKVQIFAWSLISLLYPISGVFYPLSVLPAPLVKLAIVFPISHIFEGVRRILLEGRLPETSDLLVVAMLNVGYLLLGIWAFAKGFKKAKARGWFIHPV